MDNTFPDKPTQDRLTFSRMALGLHTAIPGIIKAWDAVRCLATVQPAIRMKTMSPEGAVGYMDLPAVENVPACLPQSAAGNLFLTVPIKAGDTCLLIFAERAIDNVVAFGTPQGKPQNPVDGQEPQYTELRHHDLSDAMFIPGLMTVPQAIPSWASDAIEIRNAAGTVRLSVKADAVYILGDLHVTGNVDATGEVTAKLGGTNIDLSGHKHTDAGGTGNSGGPVP